MRYNKHKKLVSLIALILVIVMAATLVLGSLSTLVSAASSSELKKKLSGLKGEASELAEKADELDAQIAKNRSETESVIDQKAAIDQKILLTTQEIANINEQISQYNQLIANKQADLESAEVKEEELNALYRERLRAMEENGDVSYWSILFGASSFTDLLSRVDMISDIAESDLLMIEKMKEVAVSITQAREELEQSRLELEESREQLTALEEELASDRIKADELITELMTKADELVATSQEYDEMEDALREQIMQVQTEYEEALADEEAARRARQAREEAASGKKPAASSSRGFYYPLPAGTSYVSCAYGYRYHPIYGYYKMHYGVDLAANSGTPIYAMKSGTVTLATYSSVNGNYVTINHGDGFSSLYAHMTHYIVSNGQWVEQGQTIGYVGSTGWSTGPHLHFEVFYGGSNVNPMDYVSVT